MSNAETTVWLTKSAFPANAIHALGQLHVAGEQILNVLPFGKRRFLRCV